MKRRKNSTNKYLPVKVLVSVRNKALLFVGVVVALSLVFYFCTGAVHKSKKQLDSTVYPRTYSEIVEKEAKSSGVEPALVYAVIRQESRFDPTSVSKAGAAGLMQIMPDTFNWLTETLDKDDSRKYTEKDLFDPEINVRFGCRYLAVLQKQYSSQKTVLAAYNAGIGNVNRWLKDTACSDDGVSLKNIPFPETQEYTKRVTENYIQYKALYYTDVKK